MALTMGGRGRTVSWSARGRDSKRSQSGRTVGRISCTFSRPSTGSSLISRASISYPTSNWTDPHKTTVDRRSLFFQRVCSDVSLSKASDHLERAGEVINNVLHEVFANDPRFVNYFDISLHRLIHSPQSLLEVVGPNVFDCRLFLKDFVKPNTCQVKYPSYD